MKCEGAPPPIGPGLGTEDNARKLLVAGLPSSSRLAVDESGETMVVLLDARRCFDSSMIRSTSSELGF